MIADEADQNNDKGLLKKRKRLSKKERKKLKKLKKQETKKEAKELSSSSSATAVIETNYLEGYTPITEIPGDAKEEEVKTKDKSLGKWFPSAKLVKSIGTGKRSSLLLFYQYAQPLWPQEKVDRLLKLLVYIGQERQLGGRIRVAREGVNATVSCFGGAAIRHLAEDLKVFDGEVFSETDFKFIDDLAPDRHFKDLKVYPVQEIVYYGITDSEAPLYKGGVHLDPVKYHEKLKEDNTVVIDVRNHYEAAIGRFDGQALSEEKKGAEYIDPKMRRSTDFPSWLASEETQKKLEGKQVLMYCTGGVRCERASAYLKSKIGDKVDGVYQLKGGIEKYFKEFPDGGFWRGKNYVFDKREAVGVQNPDGDGGVVRKLSKAEKKSVSENMSTKCCCCGSPWDRYIGKKRCFSCGVPVLMCNKCMSLRPDKNPEMKLKVRCPLCVENNLTHEFTESNGTKATGRRSEQEY